MNGVLSPVVPLFNADIKNTKEREIEIDREGRKKRISQLVMPF